MKLENKTERLGNRMEKQESKKGKWENTKDSLGNTKEKLGSKREKQVSSQEKWVNILVRLERNHQLDWKDCLERKHPFLDFPQIQGCPHSQAMLSGDSNLD